MLLSDFSKKQWVLISTGIVIYAVALLWFASFDLNNLYSLFEGFTIRFFVCSLIWVVPSFTPSITKLIGFEQTSDFHSFQYLFSQDGSYIGLLAMLLVFSVVLFFGSLFFGEINRIIDNGDNGSSFETKMKTSKKIQITLPSSTITMAVVIVVSYLVATLKINPILSSISGFIMVFNIAMLFSAIVEGGTYEFIEPKQEESAIKGEVNEK